MRFAEAEGHRETDLGFAAAVTDRGLRHRRNEDAYGLAVRGGRAAVVVCDGVSSSANPDQASAAAADAALEALLPVLEEDQTDDGAIGNALLAAVAAAHLAVGEVPDSEPGGYPAAPSTTIVVALVGAGRVAVASVGDSRAYWLAPAEAAGLKLTVDDSLAEVAIAQGVPAEAAYLLPQAHVITSWIGADARGPDPEVKVFEHTDGGVLLVCTDGLWGYFEPPERLAALIVDCGDAQPVVIARQLVDAAIRAGGDDNITAAVIAVPPANR